MILNVILIAGGLLFFIATGAFVIALIRAPLGIEGEDGFRAIRNPSAVRKGRILSADPTGFPNPTPNSPLTVH
jgi:hypothetical protein